MEDNNYKHEEFDNCLLCKHPVLKHILLSLMVFLGAFAAFYVVSDWHFKRILTPEYQMRQMNKAMMREEHKIDKLARKEMKQQLKMERNISQFFQVEKTPDSYRIIVDLRPFDNDEKNVEVRSEGHTLIITAAGAHKNKNEIIKVSQAFSFNDDVDLNDITKVREGNRYIITLPIDN